MLHEHLRLISNTDFIISLQISFLVTFLPLNFPVSAIGPFAQVGNCTSFLDLLLHQVLSLIN